MAEEGEVGINKTPSEEEKEVVVPALHCLAYMAELEISIIEKFWDILQRMDVRLNLHHSLITMLQQECQIAAGSTTMDDEWQSKLSELE